MTNNVKRVALALLIIAGIVIILGSLNKSLDAGYQCEDVRGGQLIEDTGAGNCSVDGKVIFVGN